MSTETPSRARRREGAEQRERAFHSTKGAVANYCTHGSLLKIAPMECRPTPACIPVSAMAQLPAALRPVYC